jgi:hypothetical protein
MLIFQLKKINHSILVAKFLVPDWEIWSTLAQGCRTAQPAYVAWRDGTTTLCQSQLYPPIQGLRIWLQEIVTPNRLLVIQTIVIVLEHLAKRNRKPTVFGSQC